jgi:hypothetical protein
MRKEIIFIFVFILLSSFTYGAGEFLNMSLVTTYYDNAGAGSIEGSRAIFYDYLRDLFYVTGATDDSLTALNVSNRSTITVFGSVQNSGTTGSLDGIYYGSIDVENQIFYGPAYVDDRFSLYNITPGNPTLLSASAADSAGAYSQDGIYDVTYVYFNNGAIRYVVVGSYLDDYLSVFNVTNPTATPTGISTLTDAVPPCSVDGVTMHFALPTAPSASIKPVLVLSTIDSELSLYNVTVSGGLSCTTGYTDTADDGSIEGASTFFYENDTGLVYITSPTDGYLTILNLSVQTQITLVGSVGGFSNPVSVTTAWVGDTKYAFIGSENAGQGIQLANVTNPASPTKIDEIFNTTSGSCVYNAVYSLKSVDNYLFLSSTDSCFYTIKLYDYVEEPPALEEYFDYSSSIDTSTVSYDAVGRGYNDMVWIKHNLTWFFYADGTNFVYRVSNISNTPTWGSKTTAIAAKGGSGANAAVTFDGTYFHFAYYNNTNNINYRRALANTDGTLTFDTERVAYTYDGVHTLGSTNRFTVFVDSNSHVWIMAQHLNGTLQQPWLHSNINTSGHWVSRTGFPVIMDTPVATNYHGSIPQIEQICDNNVQMLFIWDDEINNNRASKLWSAGSNINDEGSFSTKYSLGTPGNDTVIALPSVSVVSPKCGEALVTSPNLRLYNMSSDGNWTNIKNFSTAGTISFYYFYGLTFANDTLRMWTANTTGLYYEQSTDYGSTWGSRTKVSQDIPGIRNINPSRNLNGEGDYHIVSWSNSSGSPYGVGLYVLGERNGTNSIDCTCSSFEDCVTPTAGMFITEDTTFCTDTYFLNNYGKKDIWINNTFTPITLDCAGSTLIGNNSVNWSIAIAARGSYITIKNCNLINYSVGIESTNYDLSGNPQLTNLTIDNVSMIGMGGVSSIFTDGSHNITVKNSRFYNNTNLGQRSIGCHFMYFSGYSPVQTSSNGWVYNNYMYNASGTGIKFNSQGFNYNWLIYNNTFEKMEPRPSDDIGVHIATGVNVSVYNNIFLGWFDSGVLFNEGPNSSYYNYDNKVYNNNFTSVATGVWFKHHTATNNSVYNNTYTGVNNYFRITTSADLKYLNESFLRVGSGWNNFKFNLTNIVGHNIRFVVG